MKGTFLNTVLVLAISLGVAFAAEFPLPTGKGASFKETKAICTNYIRKCWFISYISPSRYLCGSDKVTYNGECDLCYRIVYEKLKNVTKLHNGPCKNKSHHSSPAE
ncbi:serine protease inhibitor Kazal-type 8 isoform 2-T2 [Molossus nigricans]|uniref:Putative serine peptidase inhibitor Kazal type 8 (Putative) n=1 Tax=Molossus molossus TaxID=27622 RepID=A0A7J8DDZ7_MOLMO|nr:serine protease inhibitor Kazal-type 8 [Molossus molossus]KAF6421275.1 putative serine peptidase inhibitor Kazal type 8 (putative) [Molossus molossus]